MKNCFSEIDSLADHESQDFYNAISEGNDISCVLIATSYIDRCLTVFLKQILVKGETSKRLLEPDKGLLGNIRAKSDVIYCLDLIPKDFYSNLIKIGEIRNIFAHKHLNTKFENEGVQSLCHQLVFSKLFPYMIYKDINTNRGYVYDDIVNFNHRFPSRNKFCLISSYMAERLLICARSNDKSKIEIKKW